MHEESLGFLERLLETPSPSGYEQRIQQVVREWAGRYAPVDPALADGLAEEILTGVAGLGGTISAEHGVGIAKAKWLPLVRRADELAAAAAVKAALDPSGVLNPGVLTP